jgi:hypothetical protein
MCHSQYIPNANYYRQHVYRDLHPYCCTFDNCTTADRLYDSRHSWFKHELEAHRNLWHCIEGCDKTFSSKCDFELHVNNRHTDLADPNMLSALERTSKKVADVSAQVSCPFCNMSLALSTFKRHVGRHQEQLALFALPSSVDEKEDGAQDEGQDFTDSSLDLHENQETGGKYDASSLISGGERSSSILDGIVGSDDALSVRSNDTIAPIPDPEFLASIEDSTERLVLPELENQQHEHAAATSAILTGDGAVPRIRKNEISNLEQLRDVPSSGTNVDAPPLVRDDMWLCCTCCQGNLTEYHNQCPTCLHVRCSSCPGPGQMIPQR